MTIADRTGPMPNQDGLRWERERIGRLADREHASIGVWLELHWVGKPKPPGGVQHFEADRMPAFLIQWSWVITMTLHREAPDPDEWIIRQLDGLEEPLS